MSLINQVLRDLDQRQAGAPAMPSAVRSAPLTLKSSRPRAIAMAAASLAAIGGAAAAWAWSVQSRPAAAPLVVAPVAASAPAPVPVRTPVVVVTAASAPVAAASAPVAVAKAAPATTDAWPSRTLAVAPTAAIAPAPIATPTPAAPPAEPVGAPPVAAEPRIDKRAPARTAQERAEAAYQRGVAAHHPGQLDDAAAAYVAALREDPKHTSARQALAAARLAQGRADEAKSLLGEGLALSPQHAGLSMMLARLCVQHGDLPRAAEVLQPLMHTSLTPEDRAFHAAVLQRLNRHAEAAELFAAAVRIVPDNGVWWMGLGLSLAADGRNDVAREAFQRARSTGGLSPELAGYVEQRLKQL